MNLKQMRVQRGIQQKELARMIGVDEPTLSKLENYKFLPTPEMLTRILQILDCGIKDVYSASELRFRDNERAEKRERRHADCYKLTVRLPQTAKNDLQVALKALGYSSITAWLTRCTEDLRAAYEGTLKQKETSSLPTKTEDEVQIENTQQCATPSLYHNFTDLSRGEVKKDGEKGNV